MTTVVISGELDVTTVPLLSRHLGEIRNDRPQRLVWDMAGVDFIDCASIRLITATGRFLPYGQRPVIRCPSQAVRRLLALTGLAVDFELDVPR